MPSLPRLADDPPRGCHYAARFLTDGAGQEFGEAVWIEVAPMLRGVNGTVLADVPRTIRREQGLGEVRACLVGDSQVSGWDGVEQQALRDGYGHRVDDAALLHCWRAAAPPGSDALARELLDRWREPHRHYHTLAHLAAMLAIVGQWPVVELAVWFHDAVYDPRATDNEEASAELAERSLPAVGAAPATVAEVARLVRLTATHDSAPGDGAGALLCDADCRSWLPTLPVTTRTRQRCGGSTATSPTRCSASVGRRCCDTCSGCRCCTGSCLSGPTSTELPMGDERAGLGQRAGVSGSRAGLSSAECRQIRPVADAFVLVTGLQGCLEPWKL